eukprot:1148437-Pelagomonas_calceolata.AAC.3
MLVVFPSTGHTVISIAFFLCLWGIHKATTLQSTRLVRSDRTLCVYEQQHCYFELETALAVIEFINKPVHKLMSHKLCVLRKLRMRCSYENERAALALHTCACSCVGSSSCSDSFKWPSTSTVSHEDLLTHFVKPGSLLERFCCAE